MIPAGRNDGGYEVSRKKEGLEATGPAQPLPGMNTSSMYQTANSHSVHEERLGNSFREL